MDIVEILKVIIWPLVVIIAFFALRQPLGGLILKMSGLEYEQDKDGKKRLRVAFIRPVLEETRVSLELPQQAPAALPPPADPKMAIIEALRGLEDAAERKLIALGIDYQQNGFRNTALWYLETRGTFPPNIESAIQNLTMLRNRVTHYPSGQIGEEDANEYVRVANEVKRAIEAVQSLPMVQLNGIVVILRCLTCAIDTGQYDGITIREVYDHIENETILSFISELDGGNELRGVLEMGTYDGLDHYYTKALLSIYHAYAGDHRRKWGVENRGLCLALAWTIELIQMGSGWHPSENLSEL